METDNQNLGKRVRAINNNVWDFSSKVMGVFRIPSFREGLLVLICFLLLITLLQIRLFPRTLDVKVGQASKMDIYAPRAVVNPEATKLVQQEAVDRALQIAKLDSKYYRIDESISQLAGFNLNRAFNLLDTAHSRYLDNIVITKEDLPVIKYQKYFYEPPSFALLKKIVLLDEDAYQELKVKSQQILEEIELKQRISIEKVSEIRLMLPDLILEKKVSEKVAPVLKDLLEISVQPNLILDSAKLATLEQQVRDRVPDVVHRKKELLVAKNQVVTENDFKMLKELHLIVDESNQIKVFLSLAFFTLLLVGLGLVYIFQFHPNLLREEGSLYLLLLLLLLMVGLIKVLSLTDIPSLPYLAPVSFAAMLAAILVKREIALALTAIISLLGGVIVEYNLSFTIFYFVSGIIAVLTLFNFQRQRDLVRSGWILIVANLVTVAALNLLFRSSFSFDSVILAATNGFLSSVLAIGSLPFLEHIFKITTPIRLLELANPSNPLLRRLQIEAPGTYHHSIMVGNLAEAAAEGIGADTLWVRVGSYYHDIGKIKRPYFFVENQFSLENPHEKLNPSLSTLIITYHVKEGVEIAREHGLPDKLIDIIEQHHGTDLVRYFYKRATENLQGEREILIEEDFRYEGPKPQSKEAALVMLADSVEAAVKALSKPSPSKVEGLIQKIIRERLDDGQFDECNLTLKDLNSIKNSFTKILGGMFHSRIEYPENVLKEMERKKTDGGSDK